MGLIASLAIELGKKGLESISENVGEKLSDSAMNWIKGLFFKGNEPKKALAELQNDPENESKQQVVEAIISNSIEDNKSNLEFLSQLISVLPKSELNIEKSNNINTGNVNTGGGDFRIGDNYGG